MVFAKITTTIDIVLLMGVTVVDPVSIENSAQNANAKLDTLTKSQMQEAYGGPTGLTKKPLGWPGL